MHSLSDLYLALSNLTDLARGWPPLLAFGINLVLTLIGVGLYYYLDGWLAFIALAWAILNLLGIVKWVFQL